MDLPNYTIMMDENKKKEFEGKIKSFVLITTKKLQPFMAMKIFL